MSKGVADLIEYVASPAYQDSMLLSSDRSILGVRSVEIIPRESSTFGYQNAPGDVITDTLNDKMTFHISDPRHYLDLKNSWFQCGFKCRAVDTGNVLRLDAFLDNGGIHALIKNIIIRVGSVELHRIEHYNKLYNIINLATYDMEHRNRFLGDCADSYNDQYCYSDGGDFRGQNIVFTNQAAYTTAGRTLILGVGSATTQLKTGDVLRVVTAAFTRDCIVTSITGDSTINVDGLGGVDIAAGAITQIILLKRSGIAARKRVVSSKTADLVEEHKLAFKIPFGFMDIDSYFPLPYLNQPLEVTFEFVEPALGIIVPQKDGIIGGAAITQAVETNHLGYAITRPRFVARMVEPSADVFESHKQMWKEDGLVYKMMNYRTYESQIAASSTQVNLTYQTNIKSLQSAFVVLLDQGNQSASGNRALTQAAYSQSAFLKQNLKYFQFKSGGQSWPDYGVCNVDDISSGQAWKQLQLALGTLANKIGASSIDSWKWADVRSDKFIIASLFAKEHDVYNTGVDVSSNYLELELNFNALAAGPPVVGVNAALTAIAFLAFDECLVLSQKDGLRSYY